MRRVIGLALAAVVAAVTVITAQRAATSRSIEGLWGAEYDGGPRIRGDLTVHESAGRYVATIGGFEVPVESSTDLHFTLPGGNGEFRGSFGAARKDLSGHWIQPRGPVSFQPRATPVRLRAVGPAAWSGKVEPLEERLHLFVDVQRRGDTLTAVVRIPETNWWGNQRLNVEVDGTQLLFKGPPDIRGSYDPVSDRLVLSLVEDPPQLFTRRGSDEAVGFYARSPQHMQYAYRAPAATDDGWKTTTLRGAGLDPVLLTALVQTILDADGGDPDTFPLHSLVIARHGQLAMEEYFYGFDRDRPHDSRSAGKTFAPLLVGIAKDRGGRVSPQTSVTQIFARYGQPRNDDSRKQAVSVEDVMTMRSGLACDDNDAMSPGGEDRMQRQRDQPDWYKFTLDLPMVSTPAGGTALYCSASLNLAGGIAGAVVGMWNADLFRRHVALPLQFGTYHLNLMPTGDAYFGGGVYLRPRDFLKLGQLYLDGGVWNGHRVISREWVERSTKSYGRFVRPDWDPDHEYGYGWHLHHFTVGGRTYREYAAEGNGGQLVMVFPELDMAVGINAGKYNSPAWYRWTLDIIPRYLIPSVKD